MKYFEEDFIQFFKELGGNNNKEWFHASKKRYEKVVKNPFQKFVADLIENVKSDDSKFDTTPKDSIFRINRDIRFAKDKSPYKIQVSAIVSPGGKKDKTTPGIYVELTPEHVRVYGGVYVTDKDLLYRLREQITSNLSVFKKAYSDKNFQKYYGDIKGEKNKIIPKEFRAQAEKEPLVFNKQFYYFSEMTPEVVLEDNFMQEIMDRYHASKPVKNFLTKAIG